MPRFEKSAFVTCEAPTEEAAERLFSEVEGVFTLNERPDVQLSLDDSPAQEVEDD